MYCLPTRSFYKFHYLNRLAVQNLFSLSFTFPDAKKCISQMLEAYSILNVSLLVAFEFGNPIFGVCFWNRRISTIFVLVPETPHDFYSYFEFLYGNIRFSWKVFVMKSVSQTIGVQDAPDFKLRSSIF